jgi:hypothetical protein
MQSPGFNEAAAELSPEEKLERDLCDHQPPYRFEKATGLKGIGGNYKYPASMNAVQFDDAWTWTFIQKENRQILPTALVAAGIALPEYPRRMDINDYMATLPQPVQGMYRNVWDELVALNPQLKGVRVDKGDIGQVYDAINGVASGFNVTDINYYLEADSSREARLKYFAHPLIAKIDEESGAHMCWIAAPETLQQVSLQLDERKARAAAVRRSGCDLD